MKILCIGGGTGGHILPLYNLIKALNQRDTEVHLVVNNYELDKKIVQESFTDITLKTHYFRAYKLHYHLAFSNLINWWRILLSVGRARRILRAIEPDVIFFKGGFVGFPFLIAAKFLAGSNAKIYLHESDISTGALSKLFGKHADRIFSNFGDEATPLFYWPSSACHPEKLRDEGSGDKPQILIFGGSQGAQFINKLILSKAAELCEKYQVVLVTGPGKLPKDHFSHPDLMIHEFLEADELVEQIFCSNLIIARAGASIFQVLAAQKPLIMIPLPTAARNHQQHNADYFVDKGLGYLLPQNKATKDQLLPTIEEVLSDITLAENLKKQNLSPKANEIARAICT